MCVCVYVREYIYICYLQKLCSEFLSAKDALQRTRQPARETVYTHACVRSNKRADWCTCARAVSAEMMVGADRPRWLKETDDTNELEWLRQVLDCCMHMCAGVLVCRCAQACPRVRRFER